MTLEIRKDDLTGPEIRALVETHLEVMRDQTPPEAVFAFDISSLQNPDVAFYSAWDNGTLIGMGAVSRITDQHAEIKSMHVLKAHRGAGHADAILRHLEQTARAMNYERLSLETGSYEAFLPARQLYARHGYVECPAFEGYISSPLSTYMTKTI